MKEKFTIIIPTHNKRSPLVERLLEYYNNFPVNIIIEDGSVKPYKYKLNKNISYFHYPKKDFIQRVQHALKICKTKYVAINQDDDFLIYSSLLKGKKFLDLNCNYSFVSGKNFYFEDFFNFVHLKKIYKDKMLKSIDNKNNINRLLSFFNSPQMLVASLFKKQHIKKNIDNFSKFRNKIILNKKVIEEEMAFSLFMLSNYKYKYLDIAWQLRDRNVYLSQGSRNKYLSRPYLLVVDSDEYKKLYNTIKNIYKIKNNMVLDKSLKMYCIRPEVKISNFKAKLLFNFPNLFNILRFINKVYRIVILEKIFVSKIDKQLINKINKFEYNSFLFVLKKYKPIINKLALNKVINK